MTPHDKPVTYPFKVGKLDDLVPCQGNPSNRQNCVIPKAVHLRAYEVYAHVHVEQFALVDGWCRGGFGVGEVIAFLYAYGFPRSEWSKRVDEAMKGMNV